MRKGFAYVRMTVVGYRWKPSMTWATLLLAAIH